MHVARAPRRQRADHEAELAPLVGEDVLRARRMLGVEAPRAEPVLFHQLESLRQERGRDAGQGGVEVLEPPWPVEQVANDEERPPLAHELERLRDRAGLTVMFRHALRIRVPWRLDSKM